MAGRLKIVRINAMTAKIRMNLLRMSMRVIEAGIVSGQMNDKLSEGS